MSLDTNNLSIAIKNAMLQQRGTPDDTTGASFADDLATAIKEYLLQLEIAYSGGLSAPDGPVGGTFNFTFV